MEQINKAELRGTIGNISFFNFGESRLARFTIATSYAYKMKNGTPVIDTTWHNVSVWEGKAFPDLSVLEVGKIVHVIGRIRHSDYTSPDGTPKRFYEIIAQKVMIEEEKAEIQCA